MCQIQLWFETPACVALQGQSLIEDGLRGMVQLNSFAFCRQSDSKAPQQLSIMIFEDFLGVCLHTARHPSLKLPRAHEPYNEPPCTPLTWHTFDPRTPPIGKALQGLLALGN
eukprot:208060-Amphidinium_carterae.1